MGCRLTLQPVDSSVPDTIRPCAKHRTRILLCELIKAGGTDAQLETIQPPVATRRGGGLSLKSKLPFLASPAHPKRVLADSTPYC